VSCSRRKRPRSAAWIIAICGGCISVIANKAIAGVGHQGRGQPANRARSAEFKAAVLARYQERYPDSGPTLAPEKLTLDGLAVDHETLRGWLMKAGL
jgi:hypothetical protein